jgi:hypothetical protein
LIAGANATFERLTFVLGTVPEEVAMPHRRMDNKGSFGGRFDELVTQFPHEAANERRCRRDDRTRQEMRDIHAMLFERAWTVDGIEPKRD